MTYPPSIAKDIGSVNSEVRTGLISNALTSMILSTRWLTRDRVQLKKIAQWLVEKHSIRAVTRNNRSVQEVKKLDITQLANKNELQDIKNFKCPIHVPNFFADTGSVEYWTPEYFGQKFSGEKFRVANGAFSFEEMDISEIIQRIMSGDPERQRYVQAVSDIFIRRPEIFDDLPMERIFSVQAAGYHGAELFLGGVGTGSTWHAANEWNFFLQIHGEKSWKLLRPEYSVDMEPKFQKDLIYVTSTKYDYDNPPQATVYTVNLKPGDLLIVPPWWWHCVKNQSASTLAVSLRFRTLRQFFKSPNLTLSLLQLTSVHQWRNIWEEAIKKNLKDDKRYHHRADRLL